MGSAANNNPSPSPAPASLPETKYIEMVKHVIDIGVPEELMLSDRSIYKVPCSVREVKKDAYTLSASQ